MQMSDHDGLRDRMKKCELNPPGAGLDHEQYTLAAVYGSEPATICFEPVIIAGGAKFEGMVDALEKLSLLVCIHCEFAAKGSDQRGLG